MAVLTTTPAGQTGSGHRSRLSWEAVAIVLVAVALIGVGVAGYLAWENSRGQSGMCTIVHGCSTVQQSKYGKILGVPVSVPGLALYLVLAGAGIAWLRNIRGWRPYATLAGAGGAAFGFLFSGFLTYLEAFVIDAWCIYCVVSAALMTILFVGWAALLVREVKAQRT